MEGIRGAFLVTKRVLKSAVAAAILTVAMAAAIVVAVCDVLLDHLMEDT